MQLNLYLVIILNISCTFTFISLSFNFIFKIKSIYWIWWWEEKWSDTGWNWTESKFATHKIRYILSRHDLLRFNISSGDILKWLCNNCKVNMYKSYEIRRQNIWGCFIVALVTRNFDNSTFYCRTIGMDYSWQA